MVGPVIFDTVKRYLEYSGWQVKWVVNITDIDDKIIAESAAQGTTMAKLAAEMTADYLENLASLGVESIDEMPKATEHIGTIITFIEGLQLLLDEKQAKSEANKKTRAEKAEKAKAAALAAGSAAVQG